MQKKQVVIICAFCLISVLGFSQSITDQVWEKQMDGINTLSSPKTFDLNGDNVLDVVIGYSSPQDTTGIIRSGAMAFNGLNGDILWDYVHDMGGVFGYAIFMKVNGDDTEDVIINGRGGALLAIDGLTGDKIWTLNESNNQKASNSNYYNPQVIGDWNDDSKKDLLISFNGENVTPKLLVISSADGKIINEALLPTESETFMSPVLIDVKDTTFIIIGTGGEQHGGELLKMELTELNDDSISSYTILASDDDKGFIQPPVIADINCDGWYDIIAPNLNSRIVAFDGVDNSLIWESVIPVSEIYSGITPGFYAGGDSILDFFTTVSYGAWPVYSGFEQYLIDGKDGGVTLIDTVGYQYEFSTGVSFDNSAFSSGVIYSRNHLINGVIYNEMALYDPISQQNEVLISDSNHLAYGNSPLLTDLDNNNLLELIKVTNDADVLNFRNSSFKLSVYNTDLKSSFWQGYMGDNTAIVETNCSEETPVSIFESKISKVAVFPNPSSDFIAIKSSDNHFSIDSYKIVNSLGQIVQKGTYNEKVNITSLKLGVYCLVWEQKGVPTFSSIFYKY